MSYVAVYHVASPDTPNKVLTHAEDIAATLAEHGVRFERWQPSPIEKGASEAEMIAAYQPQIDALGDVSVAVFSVTSDHPQKDGEGAGRLGIPFVHVPADDTDGATFDRLARELGVAS